MNKALESMKKSFKQSMKSSFHFILESNGRVECPMKFPTNDWIYSLGWRDRGYGDEDYILGRIGNIELYTKERKEYSHCINSNDFDLKGYSDVLGGKIYFTPRRIRVFQMK